MENKAIKRPWLYKADKKILEALKPLRERNTRCYLSSDEGGFIGNPRFNITVEKKLPERHFETIGHMSLNSISDFILGRLLTWKVDGNRDYSETVQIKIIL